MRSELLALVEEDQRVRAELAAEGSLFDGYHPRMRAVHEANAERLASILNQRGWPGEPRVGPDGANAAWLIVQHAIGRPAFQREALEALRLAAARGEVPALQPALLEDRIRTLEGRPPALRHAVRLGRSQASSARCRSRIRTASMTGGERSGSGPSIYPSARNARPPPPRASGRRATGTPGGCGMEEWLREVGWRR